jgi:hypothetical protein
MPSPTQQTLNFVAFQSAYINPSSSLVDLASRAGEPNAPRLFAKAALLESVGWLSVGSALGFFPPDHALLSIKALFRRNDLDEVLVEWRHIFDTDWLAVLSRTDWMVMIPLVSISDPGELKILKRVFQSCLTYWSQISRSVSARAATTQFTFGPFEQLERTLDATVQIEDVADALTRRYESLSVQSIVPLAFVYAGYGESIEFLDGFRGLAHRYLAIYGSAAQGLLRKIGQLLRWRFFFFQSQTGLFDSFLEKYLDVLQISEPESRDQFRRYVKQLANDWAAYQAGHVTTAGA